MEEIIKYMDNYNQMQIAHTQSIMDALDDMQQKLHFAADELQRMEDESGAALNDEQEAKVNTYYMTSQRIKKMLVIIREILPPVNSTQSHSYSH